VLMLKDTLVPTVENVLSVYDNAFPYAMEKGLTWYDEAHIAARILSDNVEMAAGVIAVLSPLNKWNNNLYQASRAVWSNGRHRGLPVSCEKANRILNGEHPLDVIGKGSPKVKSFYQSIVDPDCDADPVIDRHAFDIAVGEQTGDEDRAALSSKAVYAQFVDIYRTAAGMRGISPKKMQAVTWIAWREAIGIAD
jgi:hypothetical protein